MSCAPSTASRCARSSSSRTGSSMSWSRPSRALLCAVLLAGILAGCGFRPLYRQDSSSASVPQFAQIAIAQPEDRPSQQLRNNLLDLLTPRGTPDRPLYLLDYRVSE